MILRIEIKVSIQEKIIYNPARSRKNIDKKIMKRRRIFQKDIQTKVQSRTCTADRAIFYQLFKFF